VTRACGMGVALGGDLLLPESCREPNLTCARHRILQSLGDAWFRIGSVR
jgi:hypothetical protein